MVQINLYDLSYEVHKMELEVAQTGFYKIQCINLLVSVFYNRFICFFLTRYSRCDVRCHVYSTSVTHLFSLRIVVVRTEANAP